MSYFSFEISVLRWPLQRMGWGLVGETMARTIWNSFTLSNRVKCLHQPNSTFISGKKKNCSDVGWGSRKRSWNRRVSATFPQNWNSPKRTGIELYGTDNHEKGNGGQFTAVEYFKIESACINSCSRELLYTRTKLRWYYDTKLYKKNIAKHIIPIHIKQQQRYITTI